MFLFILRNYLNTKLMCDVKLFFTIGNKIVRQKLFKKLTPFGFLNITHTSNKLIGKH